MPMVYSKIILNSEPISNRFECEIFCFIRWNSMANKEGKKKHS